MQHNLTFDSNDISENSCH